MDPHCVSTDELAALFRARPRTIRDWAAAGCPSKRDGRRLTFDLTEAIAWRVDQAVEQERAAWETKIETAGGDSELVGGDSPFLEKLREQRYLAAKRENDLAEGRVISIDLLRAQLAAAAPVLRNGATKVEKLGSAGKQAAEVMRQAYAAADKAVERAAADWRKP